MHHYAQYHTLAVIISVLGVALVATLGYLIVRSVFGIPLGKLLAQLASDEEVLPRGLDQHAARIAEDAKKGKIRYS